MTSNRDLRGYQSPEVIADAFSKIVSGRPGYKTVIERKKEVIKCANKECGRILEGIEKFCPDCGTKVEIKVRPTKCAKCANPISAEDKFCTSCGEKI